MWIHERNIFYLSEQLSEGERNKQNIYNPHVKDILLVPRSSQPYTHTCIHIQTHMYMQTQTQKQVYTVDGERFAGVNFHSFRVFRVPRKFSREFFAIGK